MKMIKKVLINIYGFLRKTVNNHKLKKLFSIDSFLPKYKKEESIDCECKRIKIRFLYSFENSWNSIGGLILKFKNDDKYSVKIIIGESGNIRDIINRLSEYRLNYCFSSDYNAEIDKPDIFVVYHPRDYSVIKKLRENCKLIICVAMHISLDYSTNKEFQEGTIGFDTFKPDYYLFDKMVYNILSKYNIEKEKLILTGNLIYDDIFNSLSKKDESFNKFKKLKNKHILLWVGDHGVYDGKVCNDLSFDIYAKDIFDYFAKHQDIGLIFRPHPTFINEMIRYGFWTQNEIEKMKYVLDKSENIVFDDSKSMNDALVCCDALIVDAFCSMACSSYPLHKPTGLLYRNEKIKPFCDVLANSLISIRNRKDLISYLDKFRKDYDSLCKLNYKDDDIYCYFDGNNSNRIKKIIEEKYKLVEDKY